MVGFCRIVFLFSLFNLVLCDSCEPNQGPEGIYDCVRIPKYDGYQWAICLSNQVLETQTLRKMDCKGSLFCWLPCTQSIYPNSNREHIPKECKCDPDENERRKSFLKAKGSESKVIIPTACYVPTWKRNCNWFSECLEAHSSCEGTNFNYAISYGEAMCSIFRRDYPSLLTPGKRWIRSSQKCIQDLMRSVFMPNNTAKCKDIRDLAFEIHSDCYIQRGEFCKLFGSDQVKIYWSIKQFYENAFSEKFDEGMARFRSCLQNDPKQEQRKFMFYVEKNVNHYVDENIFALSIAEKFDFSSHGLDWDVNKTFSITHKQFYLSQEYQVVQMFLSKRRVQVNKRRKRNSHQHLLDASYSEFDSSTFMDKLADEIKNKLRIEPIKVLMKGFEIQEPLVGIAVEKYRDVEYEYTMDGLSLIKLLWRIGYTTFLPGTPKSIDTKFYLFNRDGISVQIKLTDISSMNHFDPSKKTFVIIHGFQSNGDDSWVLDLRDILLIKEDANVIVVDWRGGANLPLIFYSYAVANGQLVGYFLALLVSSLEYHRNAAETYFHIIGSSLGAHVAGFAGYALKKRRLDRITGLDPVGPNFRVTDEDARLDSTDAEFVDVIHTNGGYLGYLEPMGDVDFYPNGGQFQPGCFIIDLKCSHSRAHNLFTRSVLSNPRYWSYWARRCTPLENCIRGDTDRRVQPIRMGYYAENDFKILRIPHRMYYLNAIETLGASDLLHMEILTKLVDENMCRHFKNFLSRRDESIKSELKDHCVKMSNPVALCSCFSDITR